MHFSWDPKLKILTVHLQCQIFIRESWKEEEKSQKDLDTVGIKLSTLITMRALFRWAATAARIYQVDH